MEGVGLAGMVPALQTWGAFPTAPPGAKAEAGVCEYQDVPLVVSSWRSGEPRACSCFTAAPLTMGPPALSPPIKQPGDPHACVGPPSLAAWSLGVTPSQCLCSGFGDKQQRGAEALGGATGYGHRRCLGALLHRVGEASTAGTRGDDDAEGPQTPCPTPAVPHNPTALPHPQCH